MSTATATSMFAIPLEPHHLQDLGRIAVVWGQIDYMLDEIIAQVNGFDKHQRNAFLTDKMTAAKLDMLVRDADRLPTHLHPVAIEAATRLKAVKQRRNAAFHGIWGKRYGGRSGLPTVAAYHPKMKSNPLQPVQLRGLADEISAISVLLGQVVCHLNEFDFRPGFELLWGDGPPPPERGLHKGRTPLRLSKPA